MSIYCLHNGTVFTKSVHNGDFLHVACVKCSPGAVNAGIALPVYHKA